MDNNIFQEIDQLLSELSKMDNASKIARLIGEKVRLNRLTNELAQKVYICGGFSSDAERDYARKLLKLHDEIDGEGQKATRDIANDAVKELARMLSQWSVTSLP